MRAIEIEVKVACARREMEHWQTILANKSCTGCEHYQREACTLAGGIRPPAEVIKTGCPEWKWDQIPF